MAFQTVPESREGVVGYLFYAAGALAGLSAGVLEVLARLVVAGLHLAITTRGSSNDEKAYTGARQQPCYTCEQHERREQNRHGVLSSMSGAGPESTPAPSVPGSSWTSVDASTPPAEGPPPDGIDSPASESSAVAPGGTPRLQEDDVKPEPAQGLIQVTAPDDDLPASGALVCNRGDVEDVNVEQQQQQETVASELPVVASLEPPAATSSGGKWMSDADLPSSVMTLLGGSDASSPLTAPVPRTAETPQHSQATWASPCRPVTAAGEVYEAKSESGESGITPVSYGTAKSVDSAEETPTSRRLKVATASASAAPSTPGLTYTQRLEEKRQSSRRKGAHKAKAR